MKPGLVAVTADPLPLAGPVVAALSRSGAHLVSNYAASPPTEELELFAITVTVSVKPDRREEFLAAIGRQADASRKLEPGCLRFELLESADDPLEFLIFEVYATPDDYHSAHRETPHYSEWAQVAAQVLEGERVVTGYSPVRLELGD